MATFTGTSANETITGGSTDDLLQGLAGNDMLVAREGDDTLVGGAGNDTLFGEEGVNTIVYSGNFADYTVTWDLWKFTVTDSVAGRDGVDTAYSVSWLQFSDQIVSWSTYQGYNVTGSSGNDTLVGTSLPEHMDGLEGDDSMTGLGGPDQMGGGLGNDTLDGGAGDDEIHGSFGNDLLIGGGGNDVIYPGTGDDTVDGGAGDDWLGYGIENGSTGISVNLLAGTMTGSTWSGSVTNIEGVSGTQYNDRIAGDSEDNRINANNGNDTLRGNGGDDILYGGKGTDVAEFAGNRADYWVTYSSKSGDGSILVIDWVPGRDGFDDLHEVESYKFADSTWSAGTVGERAYFAGTVGDDSIPGAGTDDIYRGLAGNDTLSGGAGNDALLGDEGVDTASYATAANSVVVNLVMGTASGGAGKDRLFSIENVLGSQYADTITGDAEANLITGGNGNDTLTGNQGFDTVDGGSGTDIAVFAGRRADYSIGYDAASGFYLLIDHVEGRDAIDLVKQVESFKFTDGTKTASALNAVPWVTGTAGSDVLKSGAGDELLYGDGGTDTAIYSTASGAVVVNLSTGNATGAAGSDTLCSIENIVGSSFADSISGDAGANNLAAGAGDDTLWGGLGNDTLDGGYGADTVAFESGVAVTVKLWSATAESANGDVDQLLDIENARGGTGNDRIEGNEFPNRLEGAEGDDTFVGMGGIDTIDGGAGVDTLELDNHHFQDLTRNSPGNFTILDLEGNIDNLIGIERIVVNDYYKIALDLEGNAGIAAKVIAAVVSPESLGNLAIVGIALSLLDSGTDYDGLVDVALHAMLGDQPSNAAVVDLLFANLLVVPEPGTRAHVLDLLDQGVYTQTELARIAADLDLNAQNIDLVGIVSHGLAYV